MFILNKSATQMTAMVEASGLGKPKILIEWFQNLSPIIINFTWSDIFVFTFMSTSIAKM